MRFVARRAAPTRDAADPKALFWSTKQSALPA